ncbi:hypothetical protein A0H81_05227 [Grifola frondosa]|uniref:Uncharacterized protein n=1 Tax=Grifola frondosa TaxID=5627 RepID=A0A1C7MDE9_GRIFR|nr:hypothetical protein A0H81_05227 [Grifola frondosa]
MTTPSISPQPSTQRLSLHPPSSSSLPTSLSRSLASLALAIAQPRTASSCTHELRSETAIAKPAGTCWPCPIARHSPGASLPSHPPTRASPASSSPRCFCAMFTSSDAPP